MPGRRIEMRKLKEVLRLRLTVGLSNRKIALCTGVGKSAVSKHVARAEELGLDWRRVENVPGMLLCFCAFSRNHAVRLPWVDRKRSSSDLRRTPRASACDMPSGVFSTVAACSRTSRT